MNSELNLSLSGLLKAIYLAIFAVCAMKVANWLLDYFNKLRVAYRIKGPRMLPFIGNAHQIEKRESKHIKKF